MLGWELPPKISGGLGTACDGLLRGLAQLEGIETTFVLPRDNITHRTYPKNVQLVQLPLLRRGKATPPSDVSTYDGALVGAAEEYADAIVEATAQFEPFDIIHAHDWLTFRAAMRISRITGKQLVVHVHSTEFDRAYEARTNHAISSIEGEALEKADEIIAVSDHTKEIIISKYGGRSDRVHTIYNGSPSQAVSSARPRLPRAERTVTFLGRMTYQKGPELFLEVAYRIWRSAPDTRFVMAGNGELLLLMKSLARALGMEKIISFPGFLSADGVAELLGCSDVLVMPSISEPFGLVALEAIHANVPVVMSDRCGVGECIDAVIKLSPEDVDTMSDACLKILRDPKFAARLSNRAKREAKRFGWNRTASQVLHIYNKLLH
jgi:glycosyltransferase involved in cell wall biosynthesis